MRADSRARPVLRGDIAVLERSRKYDPCSRISTDGTVTPHGLDLIDESCSRLDARESRSRSLREVRR